jgi:hypothetical protein
MSTRSAGENRKGCLFTNWGEDVSFPVPLVVRKFTETRLQAAPMTLDYAELPAETTDCRTQTGNTQFVAREIPPAEAA